MNQEPTATIRELDRAECEAILARNHVGRIAFAFQDRVDIQPLHYILSGAWLYGRTSDGSKLRTIRHNYWVAFEVDEIDGPLDWRSVVVHGGFYRLSPDDGTPAEREAWETAVELIRSVAPQTLTTEDPVPHRTVVFRIAVQEISGRESVS